MTPPRPTDPAVERLSERLRRRPGWLLRTPPLAGDWNMALDWALVEAAADERIPPALRFYGWDPPAVSLGRFQDPGGIDTGALAGRGWDLVRRPTGGRAVLHHLELTYSLVLPPSVVEGVGIRSSYAALTGPLNEGLRALTGGGETERPAPDHEGRRRGEPNCFALAAECDTVVGGAKLVGSAQVRHRGALLQHGSILVDVDDTAWTEILGGPGRLTTLRALLGRIPGRSEVERAIVAGFERAGIPFDEAPLPPVAVSPDAFRP